MAARIILNVAGKTRTKPYGKTVVGDRLFGARLAKGLTQEAMADLCGLGRTEYRAMEAGKNQLTTIETRKKLAKGFGVSLEQINKYLEDGRDPDVFIISGASNVDSVVTVLDARYPNRERAVVSAAHLYGIEVEHARRLALPALHAKEDPDPEWWFDQIKAALNRERLERNVGMKEVSSSELD